MSRPTIKSAVLLLSICLPGLPAAALGNAERVRLAYSTRRDLLLSYVLELEWLQETPAGAAELLARQQCRWTGYVVGSGRGGGVECIQMLVVEPPQGLADGGVARVPVRPGVQLSVQAWSRGSVSWLWPEADGAAGQALALLCAWTDWPGRALQVGRQWEARASASGSPARWQLTLTGADLSADPPAAYVQCEAVSGDPGEPQARGRIVWDLEADLLLRAEGTARWPGDHAGRLLRFRLTRTSWGVAGARRRAALRQGLTEAVRLAAAYREGRFERAGELAREFLRDRPQSPWRPLAESMVGPAGRRAGLAGVEGPGELAQALSGLVVAWQESASQHPGWRPDEVPALVELAGEFRALVVARRAGVARLAHAEDANHRALAGFALGFAEDTASLALLYELAEQPATRVRAWAAYALAVRADPQTDARLLVALLTDEQSTVRARACQAAAACLHGNREFGDRIKRLLLGRLDDDSNQVRFQAAVALERFAQGDDLARLKEAAQYEDIPLVQARLRHIIARLEATPG